VTGLDTNVLARFYVEDAADREAAQQRKAAARLFAEASALFVPKTVLLELEWVMRASYGVDSGAIADVFEHLFGLPHIRIEDRESVESAVQAYRQGLDFADALHLAACAGCSEVATFDARGFVRRAKRLKLEPPCRVPRN
jgi:predicted nucleic-acid-binding protein